MNTPVDDAIAQLRTIRTLMERAVVYRAISAPAALTAGILSLLVCGGMAAQSPERRLSAAEFTAVWLAVLAVVSALNFKLLAQNSRSRGETPVNAGMRLALRAIAPPLLAGFVLSMITLSQRPLAYAEIAATWILFYGLSLLSMGSFAPKSLLALGAGFFPAGLLAFVFCAGKSPDQQYPAALWCMALTFGLLHLVYAAAVFVLQKRAVPDTSSVLSARE